jgi:Zn-dependent M28 family amino/carboxypeptidase
MPLTSVGSACFADQWTGVEATGKLALIKRGVCDIADKIKLAKANGALGVILYHNTATTPTSSTLRAANIGLLVPVGLIRNEVGEAWRARLVAGEQLTVKLLVDSIFEERESWNVFSETIEGDPDNIIILGAHLDSVQAGAGINDDGSGVTAQIEILKALRGFRGVKNKIRFAWWGAEESGLVGSLYFTANLSDEEADKIRFYYNYDMIGSPVPVYGIYVGENPGDKVGAQLLLDYLVGKGKPAYFGSFGTGSDYVGFLNLGIPSSGVQTGGGVPADPCYHLPCDTYGNVNMDPLTANTRAAAVAAAALALSVEGLPGRSKVSANPRSKSRVRAQFDMWQTTAWEAADGYKCAHDGSKHTV